MEEGERLEGGNGKEGREDEEETARMALYKALSVL